MPQKKACGATEKKSEEEFNSGMNKVFLWKVLVFLLNKQSVYELTLSTNSKHHISNIVGSLLAHPALITSQSRSMDTLPREMSEKKGGTKKTEFMKDRTYFNFQ